MGAEDGHKLLVLHPRNNNDSLLIVADKEGESLRLALIEIKSWIEFYNFCFDCTIDGKKANQNYEALDNSLDVEKFERAHETELRLGFKLFMNKYTVPSDGYMTRLLALRGESLRELSLGFVTYSADGIHRLNELMTSLRSLERLHFEDNYMDDGDTQKILSGVFKSGMLRTLKTLRIIKNKLNDDLAVQLFKELGIAKSVAGSAPLEELVLSSCGLGDSSILGLDGIIASYCHSNCFKLDLSDNFVSENGLLMISEFISQYQVVGELIVANCRRLDPDKNSLKVLLEKLGLNRKLHTIDFSGNPIVKRSYKSVVNFLGNNKSIQQLRVSYNHEYVMESRLSQFADILGVFRFYLIQGEQKLAKTPVYTQLRLG